MKNYSFVKLYFLCYVFIQIKAETTEIRSLFVKNPELPVVHSIPGNISNGSKIEIVGQMLRPYINYFRISLSDSSNRNEHDIIFHLSVRFDKNVIVRNTLENGIWSEEERYGGCPIQRGDEFKMVILVEQDVFEVEINDRHFCDFLHRLPLESAKYLHIGGDAKIYSVNIQNSSPSSEFSGNPKIEGGSLVKNETIALESRILIGDEANRGEFPSMAAIAYDSNGKISFDCGGTIISEYYVMTAAHCLSENHPPLYVLLGVRYLNDTDNDEVKKHYVKNYTKHPEYSSLTRKNDIGLIGLRKWIYFTDTIRPARLHTDIADLDTLKKLTVAGWGDTNPNVNRVTLSNELRKIEINTKPLNECNSIYLNSTLKDLAPFKDGLSPGQYCVYDPNAAHTQEVNKDACQGDSGGPLQYISDSNKTEATIVGIVSFGHGCGLGLPSIFTRVAYYIDWITPIVWPKDVKVSITAQIPSQPVYNWYF